MSNILVIKHGALGDVVLATGPFQAIRDHHRNDRITLLTTAPYARLLSASPYFDAIWVDARPKLHNVFALYGLLRQIQKGEFSRIYDLQTSGRTEWYFRLLRRPKPEWVGTAKGSSHPHDTPERTNLHTIERHKQQLAVAGIDMLPRPDISWLSADIGRFGLPSRYAVIIPGGSSHRPEKRWPSGHYAQLCRWLMTRRVTPVLIGTEAEADVLAMIESSCRDALNLKGKTDFADLAEIARGASCVVGNDTGPMHLVSALGIPCLVLFSHASNPALCAPRGDRVDIMRSEPLSDLAPSEVIAWAEKQL